MSHTFGRAPFWFLLASAAAANGARANTATLSFSPPSQIVSSGPVPVDLLLTGLTSGSPPSVGGFDISVIFSAGVVAPVDATFGPYLGDASASETVTLIDLSVSGLAHLFEVSLLPSSGLASLQDSVKSDGFVLATLIYDTVGPGTSLLEFSVSCEPSVRILGEIRSWSARADIWHRVLICLAAAFLFTNPSEAHATIDSVEVVQTIQQ